MKICFVLNRFPELSQTFVLGQLIGLLELGHDVEILAAQPAAEATLHRSYTEAQARFDLARRTTYTGMPASLPLRFARGALLGAAQLAQNPRALGKLLDVRKFGWFAVSATTLSMARPLLDAPRRYDAIVAHFGPQGVVAAALREAGLLRGPLTTVYHGYDLSSAPRKLGRNLYRALFELGESHVAISEHGLARLRELGLPRHKGVLLHLGVALGEPPPPPSHTDDRLRLLSIGRLIAKKGFAYAIDAVFRAKAQGVQLCYAIYGAGPLQNELERQLTRAGLQGVVELRGAVSDLRVAEALRDADVLLAPSVTARDGDQEGIPMVIMEALASERAVIATRHGGIPELVENDVCGKLVAERDAPALSRAIVELGASSELRQRLGREGRKRVAASFNLVTQTRAFEQLLERVANGAVTARKS